MENKAKKRLNLGEIEVESFLTALNRDEQEVVRGGDGTTGAPVGITSMQIFC
jgi:hypothetical protein